MTVLRRFLTSLRDWSADLLYRLGIGRHSYSQGITRRLTWEYILALLGTLVGVGVAEVLCAFLFAGMNGWRTMPLLSDFIRFCADSPLVAYLFGAVLGWLLCTVLFLRRPLRYLDEMIYAAEDLTRDTSRPILLPEDLREVQDHLNYAREKALRAAASARESEQRKNDLIVYLAHDLKTPLTSVIGYLTLLRDEPQISPELRGRYTGIALDKALRLEDLINEFFDITRFNLTTLVLEPERTNLSRMLEQVTSEFLPILGEKELTWETSIPPDVELLCDRDKLQRVLDNLIRNAVNYSYPSTAITLVVEPGEEAVTLRVQNHGRTIPPEKLCHIFEQFYRVDSSRASATGGAGLGLAIAKEIVELHGGSITAESAGESIAFTVVLPFEGKRRQSAP